MDLLSNRKLDHNDDRSMVQEVNGVCTDINECQVNGRFICGIDSECQNTEGSFRCVCKQVRIVQKYGHTLVYPGILKKYEPSLVYPGIQRKCDNTLL
jgi:hypothetical protein